MVPENLLPAKEEISFMNKKIKCVLSREVREDLRRVRGEVGNEYDQNISYGSLKELILLLNSLYYTENMCWFKKS